MYITPPSKLWYPGIVTRILQDCRSYIITTPGWAMGRFFLKVYKPYKPPTRCRDEVAGQTNVIHYIPQHSMEVSTQTAKGLRWSVVLNKYDVYSVCKSCWQLYHKPTGFLVPFFSIAGARSMNNIYLIIGMRNHKATWEIHQKENSFDKIMANFQQKSRLELLLVGVYLRSIINLIAVRPLEEYQ